VAELAVETPVSDAIEASEEPAPEVVIVEERKIA
jgi:hypothetical protein